MPARKTPRTAPPPAPSPPTPAPAAEYTSMSAGGPHEGYGVVEASHFWAVPGSSNERRPSPSTGWASSPYGMTCSPDDDSIAARNRRLDACEYYYENCPPVKSAIDMFVDFVCSGVDVYHPDASRQDVHRHWWEMVGGREVSEKIVSAFFRHAYASVRIYQGDLPADLKSLDAVEIDVDESPRRPSRRRIPVRYKLLPPKSVERVGGRGSLFTGVERYGVRISEVLTGDSFSDEASRSVYESLDQAVRTKLEQGGSLIPLTPDQIDVIHYRKDDWRQFGSPSITCILKDLVLYDSMKAADKAALEGSISRVRVWKLGSMEYKVKPQPEDLVLLNEQILKVRNGASIDIIWDASLSVDETSSDAAAFLGSAKYEPVLQAIHAGLGVPQSLSGGSGSDGMTNNVMALKTLVGRLRTARALLDSFWNRQFAALQKALRSRKPAELRYDDMWTSDEATMLKLYMDAHDRGILSTTTTVERLGELPDVERSRQLEESGAREAGGMMHRQGPFNENATHPDQMLKLYVNQGGVAPSEAGVGLRPRKDGEKTPLQQKAEQAVKVAKSRPAPQPGVAGTGAGGGSASKPKAKGVAGQGRPKGAEDSGGRKRRTPQARKVTADFVGLTAKAREDLRAIEAAVQPAFLAEAGKKNLRQLTASECERLEGLKFAALMATPADRPFAADASPAESPPLLQSPPPRAIEILRDLQAAVAVRGISTNAGDARELHAAAYATFHQQIDEDDDGQAATDD